jgi:hypothetical protein
MKILGRCPACGSDLEAVRLRCTRCDTAVEGHFSLSRFDRLTEEQLHFLLIFLKSRGNIRDVERELNLSYPTVRSRLDAILAALGLDSEPRQAKHDRLGVLEALRVGEMTVDEAVARLRWTDERR